MKPSEVKDLPDNPAILKAEMVRMATVIVSYEAGKAARAAAAKAAENSDAAKLEMDVYQSKSDLEGLQDNSIDITDPIERGRILRAAINLIDALFAALPKS